MKKQLLLILLVSFSFCAKAQFGFFNMKFYDSVAVEAPKFKIKNTKQANSMDSLIAKQASNWEVTRIAVNQLPITFGQVTGKPTTMSGYGITDGVTTSSLTSGLATKENTVTTGTTAQYYRGDKTWQTLNTTAVAEGTNLYFTNARVISSTLTGLSTGTNTPITAGNSLLMAFQNLQEQINSINSNMIVNTATVGLSKTTLNSTYPNARFGFMVFCPNIILGGAIYIKNNSATGTGGNWQTISAPPTL